MLFEAVVFAGSAITESMTAIIQCIRLCQDFLQRKYQYYVAGILPIEVAWLHST